MEMLTVYQVAEALGLKPPTVWAWIYRRRLGHCKLGRAVRVPRSEVDRLLAAGMVPARPTRGEAAEPARPETALRRQGSRKANAAR